MFKGEILVKKALSIIMVLFFFCLSLGKFAFTRETEVAALNLEPDTETTSAEADDKFSVGDDVEVTLTVKNPKDYIIEDKISTDKVSALFQNCIEFSQASASQLETSLVVNPGETITVKLEGKVRA